MAERNAESLAGLHLVLLGPPGSGKGTQAGLLSERSGIPAISTGEMLREAVTAGSALGARVEGILSSGALVDDETMAEVVRGRLGRADARRGFMLDGYPRTIGQAETLGAILDEQGGQLEAVLLIQVPEPEIVHRVLARRREDDREEIIRHRLDVYREVTEPLIEYYRSRGLLREVDGDQPIEEVHRAILAALAVEA